MWSAISRIFIKKKSFDESGIVYANAMEQDTYDTRQVRQCFYYSFLKGNVVFYGLCGPLAKFGISH